MRADRLTVMAALKGSTVVGGAGSLSPFPSAMVSCPVGYWTPVPSRPVPSRPVPSSYVCEHVLCCHLLCCHLL